MEVFFPVFETFRLSEENAKVGDHKHPCASTVPHMYHTGSRYLQSLSPPTCDIMADMLHSWGHSTKYNNFLEFFDPRRRSQGTSCCPRSTSCSCGLISLPRCHGHWKTLYSCLIGTLAGNAWMIVEQRESPAGSYRTCWIVLASVCSGLVIA